MCRLLAYWGPPVPATELVVDPPHSLLVQCTAPPAARASGHVNPDGWGIAWYDDAPAPTRTATGALPLGVPCPTTSTAWPELAEVTAGRFLAHVRHKSPGSPTEVAGNAPFVRGSLAFAHNGFVAGYRGRRRAAPAPG